MDGVLCDFMKSFSHIKAQHPSIEFPQSIAGFYENLEPISDAVNAYKKLTSDSHYCVYILTAPSIYNPLSYTEKRLWVEKHLGFESIKKLIICADKNLFKGEYLIDDRINSHKQSDFEGELIHFGSKQYPNWKTIINKLL